ncbi:MAG: ABC transporter permease [Anaerolineales bacterium]
MTEPVATEVIKEEHGGLAAGRWVGRLRRSLTRLSPNQLRVISILVTLIVWEWYGRSVDPLFFSYPTAIAMAIPSMVLEGNLLPALAGSLLVLAIGWTVAFGLGVILGIFMGRYELFDNLLEWQVAALYSTPDVALIPLLILWFGFGLKAKAFVVIYAVIFPIIINTYTGVRDVSAGLVDVARAEGAGEFKVLRTIVIPSAAPLILTGMKVSVGRAVVGMVVAEMLMVISGLGGLVVFYGNQFATDKLLVIVIILALLGIGLTQLVELLERVLVPWAVSQQANGEN